MVTCSPLVCLSPCRYCLADDHQLLTDSGFLSLDAVESALSAGATIHFATLNSTTGFMEFQLPQRLIVHAAAHRTMIEVTQVADQECWSAESNEFGRTTAQVAEETSGEEIEADDDAAQSFAASEVAQPKRPQQMKPLTGVSLVVTPDHDMWIAPAASADVTHVQSNQAPFTKQKAGALLETMEAPTRLKFQSAAPGGVWQANEVDLPFVALLELDGHKQIDAFLKLYGQLTARDFICCDWLLSRLTHSVASRAVVFCLLRFLARCGVSQHAPQCGPFGRCRVLRGDELTRSTVARAAVGGVEVAVLAIGSQERRVSDHPCELGVLLLRSVRAPVTHGRVVCSMYEAECRDGRLTRVADFLHCRSVWSIQCLGRR
jgi:hypothetical protein